MSSEPQFGSLDKPLRGSLKLERADRKRERIDHEDEEKDKVRAQFKTCRWPNCRHMHGPKSRQPRLEVAHLTAKGMGGDPDGIRSTADRLVLLCFFHHQADIQDGHPEGSIERHNLKIEPLTDLGTFGPCAFFREMVVMTPTGLEQQWIEVAREVRPGEYV